MQSSTVSPEEHARLLVRASETELRAASAQAPSVTSLAEELDRCPSTAGCRRRSRLNSVVLPAPLGPRTARRSPCATSRSTSRTACETPEAPADPPQAEGRLGVSRR